MKRMISLMIPGTMPASYVGATPTPYSSQTVDNWERQLVSYSDMVLWMSAKRLRPAVNGRFVSVELLARYDIHIDTGAPLADLLEATFKAFNIDRITVLVDGNLPMVIDAQELEMLRLGVHAVQDEPEAVS